MNAKHHISHDLSLTRLVPDKFIASRVANKNRITIYHILQDRALRDSPDVIFLIFEDRKYSYADFYKAVVRAGNWLMNDLEIKKDEIVALDGNNTPEYLVLWFALEGIGAVPSFVNNNLTGKSLLHCITVGSKLPGVLGVLLIRCDSFASVDTYFAIKTISIMFSLARKN